MYTALIILAILAIAAFSVAIYYWIRQKKAPTRDRIGLANSIASTLLAAMAIVVSALGLQSGGTEHNQAVTGRGNITINGNAGGGVCAYVSGPCPNNLARPDDLAEMSASQAAAQLRKIPHAGERPAGAGPWVFLVLGTNDQGVFYRDGYTVDDHRLVGQPVVKDARPIYVDCKKSHGWPADPAAPNKASLSTWLKVRYPEPADEGDFWVYGGYAFPVGNNGDVPECPTGS